MASTHGQVAALNVTNPPLPDPLRTSIGFWLNKAAEQVEDNFADALRPFGVSPREYGILSSIAHRGQQSQQQVGRELGIDRTTMVSLVDHLEDRGLLERTRDPHDRRRYALVLSAEGERLVREVLPAVDDGAHGRYLQTLSEAEREQLLGMLQRLVEGYGGTD